MATSARISVKSCELCRKLFSVSFRGRNFSVPSFKQNSGQSYSYAFHTKAQEKFQFLTVSSQHGSRLFNTISQVEEENEADDLYRQIDVEVKGHDPMVLKSYEQFVSLAARELEINLAEVSTPPKVITRRTLLKSVHIFKKHRVQYEWRTHFKVFQFKYLTGSTADTFLEYIQRNLPEGVAMKVTRHQLERLPEHITAAINNQPEDKLASS